VPDVSSHLDLAFPIGVNVTDLLNSRVNARPAILQHSADGNLEKDARAAKHSSLNLQPCARSMEWWSSMLLRNNVRILFRRKRNAHLTPINIGLRIVHRRNAPVKFEWSERTARIFFHSFVYEEPTISHCPFENYMATPARPIDCIRVHESS
jgi:hypothetical protein